MSDSLHLERTINAKPETVYRAFTKPMMLRRWLADGAQSGLPDQSAFLLTWNLGYVVTGRYQTREENEHLIFSWQGMGEATASSVELRFRADNEGTQLDLTHSGIATAESLQRLQQGWESGLENLQSVLETGIDLRSARRPMVGIFPSPLTPAAAESLGVPVQRGTLVNDVVAGGGADQAGLKPHDVIVSLDGTEVYDYPSFGGVVAQHIAGDTLSVEFYRGTEKHSTELKLGSRPAPEIPESADTLADEVRVIFDGLIAELEALVDGHPDEALYKAPAEGEWSVMQNIAHLIWTERHAQMTLWNTANGDDSFLWMGNGEPQTLGIIAAYPTRAAMLETYRAAKAESVGMLRAIPAHVASDKASMITFAQIFKGYASHDREHFNQARAALETLGLVATASA